MCTRDEECGAYLLEVPFGDLVLENLVSEAMATGEGPRSGQHFVEAGVGVLSEELCSRGVTSDILGSLVPGIDYKRSNQKRIVASDHDHVSAKSDGRGREH